MKWPDDDDDAVNEHRYKGVESGVFDSPQRLREEDNRYESQEKLRKENGEEEVHYLQ